jgi:chorismate synthase
MKIYGSDKASFVKPNQSRALMLPPCFQGRRAVNYYVRDLQSYEEMLQIHQLQREIWGFDDPTWGLYPPMLKTAALNGGVILGAFAEGTDQMVGFSFGFIGRDDQGRFKLCSQNMGILKAWRQYGIAEALKWTQRERTLAQALTLMTWTYDPLEGPNARLNLHKLRAVSRSYIRDLYGPDFGALNAGLPTDRLLVEWWIAGPRVEQRLLTDASRAEPVFKLEGHGAGRRVVEIDLSVEAETVLVETVSDIQAVKAADLALALDWRLKLREVFEHYFSLGYIATDLVSTVSKGERCNQYVLQKSNPTLLAEIGIS